MGAVSLEMTRSGGHIAEQGDFGAEVGGDGLFAAAEDDVRLDADRTELLDAVLRGLGLVFSGGTEIGHERQMDVQAIVAAQFGAELADGFKEGEASMSPTVPPISTTQTSGLPPWAEAAPRAINS